MRRSTRKAGKVNVIPVNTSTSDCRTNQPVGELWKYSLQDCEFCEKRFKNRYDMLIHNAKHIIIPLIKLIPTTCSECGFFCISEEDLENHMSIRHKELIEAKKINNQVNTVDPQHGGFESDDFNTEEEETLDSLIKKEKLSSSTENVLQNLILNCKVDVEKFDQSWLNRTHNEKDNGDNDKRKIEEKNNTIVNLETSSDMSVSDDPIRLIIPEVKHNVNKCNSECYDSIHFEDLMKPGIFHCKHCFKRFPNRYEVITHEMVHMDLSKVICCKRQKKRHRKKRACKAERAPAVPKTSHGKHLQLDKDVQDSTKKPTRSKFTCSRCNKGFNIWKMLVLHTDKCIHGSGQLMDLCDICYYTMRNNKSVECTVIGEFQNLAEKKKCQHCGKYFHDVWMLKLTHKPSRIADRIQFEDTKSDRKPLPLTNSARLKIIQKRLKLINKYNAL